MGYIATIKKTFNIIWVGYIATIKKTFNIGGTMETAISNMLNITPESLTAIVVLFVVGVLLYLTRGVQKNFAEKLKFKQSAHIGVGTYVAIPTAIGSDPGRVEGFTSDQIIVRCKAGRRYIPIAQFSEREWMVLDEKPSFLDKMR